MGVSDYGWVDFLRTNIFMQGWEGRVEGWDEPTDSGGAASWSVGGPDPNKHPPYIHQGQINLLCLRIRIIQTLNSHFQFQYGLVTPSSGTNFTVRNKFMPVRGVSPAQLFLGTFQVLFSSVHVLGHLLSRFLLPHKSTLSPTLYLLSPSVFQLVWHFTWTICHHMPSCVIILS